MFTLEVAHTVGIRWANHEQRVLTMPTGNPLFVRTGHRFEGAVGHIETDTFRPIDIHLKWSVALVTHEQTAFDVLILIFCVVRRICVVGVALRHLCPTRVSKDGISG